MKTSPIKAFSDKFRKSVTDTNTALAEDGTYRAVHCFEHNNVVFIQFINLNDGTKIYTYVGTWAELEKPYMEAYEKDGGDAEYRSVKNWMVNERAIMNCFQKG